jgi:hypothetical protein
MFGLLVCCAARGHNRSTRIDDADASTISCAGVTNAICVTLMSAAELTSSGSSLASITIKVSIYSRIFLWSCRFVADGFTASPDCLRPGFPHEASNFEPSKGSVITITKGYILGVVVYTWRTPTLTYPTLASRLT